MTSSARTRTAHRRSAALRAPSARVRAPKPLLPPEAEGALTSRQLEILDALEDSIMVESLADVTMAEIAKRMNCSLRTLYGIAPSKDELVLIVLDRRLHRIGKDAMQALDSEGSPLTRLRAYLRATNLAVQPTTAAFARDFAAAPGAPALNEAHTDYIVAITRNLIDEAIDAGEIERVHAPAVAHVLGRLGNDFAGIKRRGTLDGSVATTANSIAEILIRGLESKAP